MTAPFESLDKKYDLAAIGSAIVDTLVVADEQFIAGLGLELGSMTLIDKSRSDKLFALLDNVRKSANSSVYEMSGGGAANVAVGLAALGGDTCFMGKIGDDASGRRFTEQLQEYGIVCHLPVVKSSKGTGRSLIIVSEQGGRTMCTHLGCAQDITPNDLQEKLIAQSKVLFFTGFLWDCPQGKKTALAAMDLAKKHRCKIAFSLSDAKAAQQHREDFMDIVCHKADITFSNPKEILTLLQASDDQDMAIKLAKTFATTDKLVVLTRGKDGVVVLGKDDPLSVPAIHVPTIRDKTGVGSLFAGAFLYGYTHGLTVFQSAHLGNLAAAEGLKTLGARPAGELSLLLKKVMH